MEMVIGDETEAYYCDPFPKLQSMEKIRPNRPRPEEIRRSRSVKKHMLIIFLQLPQRHVQIGTCATAKRTVCGCGILR